MRFMNYRNSYTNDNGIYSKDEMLDMTVREIKDRAEEFIAQHRVLGLPDEKELAGSDNVVHVNSYTREDGTKVKAHWRSKPGKGTLMMELQPAVLQELTEKKNLKILKIYLKIMMNFLKKKELKREVS